MTLSLLNKIKNNLLAQTPESLCLQNCPKLNNRHPEQLGSQLKENKSWGFSLVHIIYWGLVQLIESIYTCEVWSKITVIFKFRELRTFDLYMSVIYVDNISHFGLSVCFRQIDRKVSRVLVCTSTFNYSKKSIKLY